MALNRTVAKIVGGAVIAGGVTWSSQYIKPNEIDSPDAKGSGVMMDSTFMYMLDEAREIAGVPFRINSGYRTNHRNSQVGGVDGSAHTQGIAADIAVTDSRQRAIIVQALLEAGFTRIGIARTFVHCDIDSTKAENVIWLY